jgi:quinoprotein dehydrogenase-associated probable ABC transporter substrate-binding protein
MWIRIGPALVAALATVSTAMAAPAERPRPLRVCADPGNMPFSNDRGEGLENKIAAVLARALGTTVQYYYRPSIERGLTRTTLYADECDVMFDIPIDTERVLTTAALYRSTFVLAYRNDRGIAVKNLDDRRLKVLKVGVYQTSAIREALADHDVRDNVVIHYLSHDADLVPEHQPSYQVQQVIDGQLDVAAVWGPFAGYYKAMRQAPLTVQPVNLMEDAVPMEYDMAVALRTNDGSLKEQLERALHAERDAIRTILTDFGVPLVHCDGCLVSGDLPAHGPYTPVKRQPTSSGGAAPAVTIATLNDWLAHGADVNVELNNAIIGDDKARVTYLLDKKHAAIDARDLQGETPLLHAIRKRSLPMVTLLLEHGAGVTVVDRDGWSPLMTAAWAGDAAIIARLVQHHADLNVTGPGDVTPLGIALQYGKDAAALALVEAGADVNRPIGAAGYTPLMLAIAGRSTVAAQTLIKRGADVNGHNTGGVTALMIAAAADQPELAALLVRAGANVAAQDDSGDTALSIARAKDHPAVIKLLQVPPAPAGSNGKHAGAES